MRHAAVFSAPALPEPSRFKDVDLKGEVLREWQVFDPFLNVDKVINVPIAKHHALTGATLGMRIGRECSVDNATSYLRRFTRVWWILRTSFVRH
jgi:uncharacterized protein (DUF362 family)